MICKYCNHELKPTAKLCPYCGKAVRQNAQKSPSQRAAAAARPENRPKANKSQTKKPAKTGSYGRNTRFKDYLAGIAVATVCAVCTSLVLIILFVPGTGQKQRRIQVPDAPKVIEVSAPACNAIPAPEGNTLMADNAETSGNTVLGSDTPRSEVDIITFLDSLQSAPADAWDVSAAGDGSVLAWISTDEAGNYRLYIAGEGGVNANPDCSGLFAGYRNLTQISFDGAFHTQNVMTMQGMFDGCAALQQLDLTGFDTSAVTDMSCMFRGCTALQTVDLGSFDTANVVNMASMFSSCSSLEALDLDNFNISNVTDMQQMFENCTALKKLDASEFDLLNVSEVNYIFAGCSALEELDIKGFDTDNLAEMLNRGVLRGTKWE